MKNPFAIENPFKLPDEPEGNLEKREKSLEMADEVIAESAVAKTLTSAIETDTSSIIEEEKSEHKTKKKSLWKTVQLSAAAIVVGFTINHMYQFQDRTDAPTTAGGTDWKHEDKETEHILNALSGKEEFTEEERSYLMQHLTINFCNKNKLKIPEGIETMDMQQLEKYYLSLPSGIGGDAVFRYFRDWTLKKSFFMKRTHEELWKIEKASGSPKIRWQDRDRSLLFLLNKKRHRAHYNPLNNTIYLSPEDLGTDGHRDFISEAAHAQQFSGRPFWSYSTVVSEAVTATVKGIFNRTGFSKEWDAMYDTPGTLEHDAHSVREPGLQEKALNASNADTTESMRKEGYSFHNRGY